MRNYMKQILASAKYESVQRTEQFKLNTQSFESLLGSAVLKNRINSGELEEGLVQGM